MPGCSLCALASFRLRHGAATRLMLVLCGWVSLGALLLQDPGSACCETRKCRKPPRQARPVDRGLVSLSRLVAPLLLAR